MTPLAMADAASAGARPLHRGLPEEIVIWEILVRLPPKSLLRCRAWHHITSTGDFLLAHHASQPTLPLLAGYDFSGASTSLDICTLDTRAGIAAADQLQSVARLDGGHLMHLEASCDGLLLLYFPGNCSKHYDICNLATRQYAPLPLLSRFSIAGIYPHAPSGDFRLLLYTPAKRIYKHYPPVGEHACYVFALGSGELPRHIGWPESAQAIYELVPGVLICGRLHWHLAKNSERNEIMVFDTTAESFRKMRAPVVPDGGDLFEMEGMLGMSSFNHAAAVVSVWVMEDYESEVWVLKYRIELSVPEVSTQIQKYKDQWKVLATMKIQKFEDHWKVVVTPCGGDVLVLVTIGLYRFHLYIGSKFVARFRDTHVNPTQLRLKQTLVPHSFFPKLDGYVVNASPFM